MRMETSEQVLMQSEGLGFRVYRAVVFLTRVFKGFRGCSGCNWWEIRPLTIGIGCIRLFE